MTARIYFYIAMILRNFFALLILIVWGMSSLSADVGRGNFRVLNASTSLVNGVYLLQARMNLHLSDDALQALKNGVPLILVLDMEVERKRYYIPWNKSIAFLEQRYRLGFLSLTEQYQVTNLNTEVREIYSDLEHALSAIGEVNDFPMLDRRLLNNQEHYEASLRVRLDIKSLPAPLQIMAYVSSGWKLVSPWYSWPLVLD